MDARFVFLRRVPVSKHNCIDGYQWTNIDHNFSPWDTIHFVFVTYIPTILVCIDYNDILYTVSTYYHIAQISVEQFKSTNRQPYSVSKLMKMNTVLPYGKVDRRRTKQHCVQNTSSFKETESVYKTSSFKETESVYKTEDQIMFSDRCKIDLLDDGYKANYSSHECKSETEIEIDARFMQNENNHKPLLSSTMKCAHKNKNSNVYDLLGNIKQHDGFLIEKVKPSNGVTFSFDSNKCSTEHSKTCAFDEGHLETNIKECMIDDVNDVSFTTKQNLVAGKELSECYRRNVANNDANNKTGRTIEENLNIVTQTCSSLPNTRQRPDVGNAEEHDDSSDINIKIVKQHTDNLLEDHLLLRSNDSRVLINDPVPRALYRKHDVNQPDSRSTQYDYNDDAVKIKQPTLSAGLTCNVVRFPEQLSDQPALFKDFIKKISNDTERVVGPRDFLVLPAVQNDVEELRRIVDKTVQVESVPAQESMRFELLRSCTYRTFPKDGKPDVRKLAEAGFYYASNSDEVICYCCYKRISNWKADDDPLAIHRRISPECRFFTDAATVNVTKELTAQVESEIMAKIQGGRSRSTATQSAPLPARTDSQNPENVANTGVSLRQRPPARAHGQFTMAHSGETLLPMHQPPVSTRESTKFQSLVPQMSRNETFSPNRSPLPQTGVFVPQDRLRIPVIDTRAVQPSDDTPGQDAVIDEHVRESHSRIGEVSTSVATSSARAETSRASTEPLTRSLDSLIRSDASVLVQGMGYELPIVRQALFNLLDRGQTRPNAEEIMNEIFQIEDGTTS